MTTPDTDSEGSLEIEHVILKIKISDLVPHEGILAWHLKEIMDWMKNDGYQARPIAVSRLDTLGPAWKGKFLIHDGHHRTASLKELGLTRIMASVFDFNDARIKIYDYDDEKTPISKETVIERATSGIDVTPRFDKHFILSQGKLYPFHNNPLLEPAMHVKFSELK